MKPSLFSLAAASLAWTSAPLAAQIVYFTERGPTAQDHLGSSVACAGDVDADGVLDHVVGSPGSNLGGEQSGSATVYSGADGSVLWTFIGFGAFDAFGTSVAGCGDLNGDGHAEILVGSPGGDVFGFDSGLAKVFSGSDGSLLYFLAGNSAFDRFGESVACLGDFDGDSVPDFAVGAPFDSQTGTSAGLVRVVSGFDGSILLTLFGDGAGDRFGQSVAAAGDVNGDTLADLVVGAPGAKGPGPAFALDVGLARVFAGGTGATLFTHRGDRSGDAFGTSVGGDVDVNADGFADVLAGAPGNDDGGANAGSARVHSGINGAVLHTFVGDSAGAQAGIAVAGVGDVDRDGFDDLAVGAWLDDAAGTDAGSVRVHSGLDGSVLQNLLGDAPLDTFGRSVARAGDLNLDGFADILSGAPQSLGTGTGYARLHAGSTADISADVDSISLSLGGTQRISLNLGEDWAGYLFYMLGSATGTSPGLVDGAIVLPLNVDAYFLFTLVAPAPAILPDHLGFLGVSGTAGSSLILPPQLSRDLAGVRLHHAYLVMEVTPEEIITRLATSAQAVDLVP